MVCTGEMTLFVVVVTFPSKEIPQTVEDMFVTALESFKSL